MGRLLERVLTHSVFQSRIFLEETPCIYTLMSEQTEKVVFSTESQRHTQKFPCLDAPLASEKIQHLQPKPMNLPQTERETDLLLASCDTSSSAGERSSSLGGSEAAALPTPEPQALALRRWPRRSHVALSVPLEQKTSLITDEPQKNCFKNFILKNYTPKVYVKISALFACCLAAHNLSRATKKILYELQQALCQQ